MQFTVPTDEGEAIEFECADSLVSRWVNEDILRGRTYPYLPFVDDVKMVLDVGANCGAASVHLARHHPGAQVHAFEPASAPRAMLERNVASFPNVQVHPFGLFSSDDTVPLYLGDGDSGQASIYARGVNLAISEPVQLRAAGSWASEHGIDRIDILKVDVEGAEVEVLSSLEPLLPSVKVLYVEYDSRGARRQIASLMEGTHELYVGSLFLDQGEIVYLREDLADRPAATDHLRKLLRMYLTTQR